MNPLDNIVASLVEFSTPAQIRELWRQIDESLRTRARDVLTINSKSVDGRSTSAITLATPEEKHLYITACRLALAQIEDTDINVNPRIQNDFSTGVVLV